VHSEKGEICIKESDSVRGKICVIENVFQKRRYLHYGKYIILRGKNYIIENAFQ